jgi:glycosyltransferase involved in cell wall biosynthesis
MASSAEKHCRKVRVTHVVGQLRIGGMEKLLVELARHADRDRFELSFSCLESRGPLADEIENFGWEVRSLGCAPGLRPSTVWRLARQFIGTRSDVIHTHNNAPLIYSAPAARLAGAALIQTRHGQAIGTTRQHRAAFRLAAQFADRVVCVSEDGVLLSVAEGIPPRKLAVIRNGIDTSRFGYLGPCPGGPIVMVGRLVAEKGVDTLLRAASLIVRHRPEFRLEIAGDGPARPWLEALAGKLRLGSQVRFLGNVEDIPGLLARASALALPSLSEGIPLTLLEAMARGLPIVATRVGGNPEVVENTVTGQLVPVNEPDTLARALLLVWPVSDRTRQMGRAGRDRVVRLFDVRRMVADYEALYLGLTKQRSCHAHPVAN